MPQFAKYIQTQKGILSFYFNCIYTVNGTKYHVSVRDKKSTHYFMMGDGDEQWHFSDKKLLPAWIVVLERNLEEAINEYLTR
jgi:hypothetical protein